MKTQKRFNRKLFLTFAAATPAALVLGCSSDNSGPTTSGAGAASGGAAGSPSGGMSGSSAGSPSGGAGAGGAGAGGAGTAGSSAGNGGSSAGSSGSAGSGAGAAGSSAGAGGAAPTPDCSTQLKTLITGNHGHVFNVSNADVMAGVDKVYDTTGTATHPHFLQVTAADFAKLKAGGTVRKLSCNDGHEHEFIVNCLALSGIMQSSGISSSCDALHKCGDTNTDFCPALPT
ncbi:MAG TPA: hypothetical protein VGL19_13575 [Polyangiaceae bacterium]